MVGDIVLNAAENCEPDVVEAHLKKYTTDYRVWVLNRVVESVMMATNGGSQEEGTMAGLRKLILITYGIMRGGPCGVWDVKGLCDSINECLINRPLAMYFAKSFIDCARTASSLFGTESSFIYSKKVHLGTQNFLLFATGKNM